ncbi:MAG: RNA polymerase sporulation sigma factor SigE [Clostridia bacterium]|nr:RNA polymerase sporulation sigma factor SigE [Clostridia bacterium]MBR2966918.1 RNA polymerase sporulation sigma factor SigE [Clostridia bacterium]
MKLLQLLAKLLSSLGLSPNMVCYLCGTEALPKPLDSQTEALLLAKSVNGDTLAKEKLVEHNLRLVVFLAKKFDNTGVDMEDLVSVGTIGLIKAINSFKAEKQIKLATYASRCIENEILMYLRKLSKRKQEVSLDEPLNVDGEGNELLLGDILGTDSDAIYTVVENQVERQLLEEGLAKLSQREQRIIQMRFGLDGGEEKTQKEVADILGISQSYISRLEKKIISRLKREIGKLV